MGRLYIESPLCLRQGHVGGVQMWETRGERLLDMGNNRGGYFGLGMMDHVD